MIRKCIEATTIRRNGHFMRLICREAVKEHEKYELLLFTDYLIPITNN